MGLSKVHHALKIEVQYTTTPADLQQSLSCGATQGTAVLIVFTLQARCEKCLTWMARSKPLMALWLLRCLWWKTALSARARAYIGKISAFFFPRAS
jgi:hypothetical protein